jgi:hypothetical protein
MDTTIRKRITAQLGPRRRCQNGPFRITELGFDPADSNVTQTLQDLVQEGVISWQPGSQELAVKKPETVGAMDLVRNFCRKNFGNVSPLVDRDMASAILKRHGANYSLDCPDVRADLEALAQEGYLRVLDNDRAFFKMLGAD